MTNPQSGKKQKQRLFSKNVPWTDEQIKIWWGRVKDAPYDIGASPPMNSIFNKAFATRFNRPAHGHSTRWRAGLYKNMDRQNYEY